MKTTANGTVRTVPVNGQPTTLLELVEHEAIAYRAQGTPIGDFLASQMVGWPSSSAGPARRPPRSMRLAWNSGMRPSASSGSSAAWPKPAP
jgi:hypothetical protein